MPATRVFLSWGMLIVSVFCNAFGIFAIKLKLNELGEIELISFKAVWIYLIMLLRSKLVVGGVILFMIAPFLFAVALSRMEITVAYPVLVVLNFVLLFLLAVFFLGESVTLNKTVAVIFAFLSIYFLNK